MNQYVDLNDELPSPWWYWVEELEPDHPPQLLRRQTPRIPLIMCLDEQWERWTVSGWVPVTGRVCPISPRPEV
jgi:hypothetical protein